MMFYKNDAERIFSNYGFNQTLKNDETIEMTAKAFSSSEYTVANGPKGRNRLNSGILRNQFLLLLDSLNGRPLNDYVFSGISLLRKDQYVLVHQDPNSELWEVYQGNTPNNPKMIFPAITLKSFFDEIARNQKEASVENEKHVDFLLLLKESIEANPSLKQSVYDILNGVSSSPISGYKPSQVIYYGVPGCGKSKTVNEEIDGKLVERGITDKEFHKMRVVFHKEYSNADFLGQILPCVKEKNVDYHFTPGPFAQIIRRAYRNPTEPFFLIVEEINRGDAPAIFGEMFQLLDRVKPNEIDDSAENVFAPGWSSYGITNHDLNAYIRLKSEVEEPCYENVLMIPRDDCNSKINKDGQLEINEKMLYFGGNSSVRLPPNLSILATMNTSDQNVFTLDNAFQRRFAMKMIPNVLDESSAQYNMLIDGTGVCWGKFREWINKKVNEAPFAVSTEDKCLGGWFICGEKESEDKCKPFDKVEFAEKVLKYLWDDAFKRRRPDIFESNVKSLSDLISRFCEGDGFDSFTAVFKMNDADVAALKAVSLNPPAATAEPVTETA